MTRVFSIWGRFSPIGSRQAYGRVLPLLRNLQYLMRISGFAGIQPQMNADAAHRAIKTQMWEEMRCHAPGGVAPQAAGILHSQLSRKASAIAAIGRCPHCPLHCLPTRKLRIRTAAVQSLRRSGNAKGRLWNFQISGVFGFAAGISQQRFSELPLRAPLTGWPRLPRCGD